MSRGSDNLGIGVYRARIARQELESGLGESPRVDSVEAGRHLLVLSERGDPLAEVVAANLGVLQRRVLPRLPGAAGIRDAQKGSAQLATLNVGSVVKS
jgi:hypothetical protein